MQVDECRADNQFSVEWTGDVQLKWKHFSHGYPPPTSVGKPALYDVVSVGEGGDASLQPLAAATSLTKVRNGKCRFQIWLQARANECDSDLLRVEINWDGVWERNDEAMLKHFIIKSDPQPIS